MRFSQEGFEQVKDDIKPLIEEHWHEIALNKDAIKLNPDWENYAMLDKLGALRIYTGREDGELKGYFILITSRSLHYKDHLFANNDIIFISKSHRKGLTGLKLIKYAMKKLKDEGVTLMNVNTKLHQPFDAVMERLGFNCIERIYSINLRS